MICCFEVSSNPTPLTSLLCLASLNMMFKTSPTMINKYGARGNLAQRLARLGRFMLQFHSSKLMPYISKEWFPHVNEALCHS